mmetsp:Transcript_2980/g.6474  ORF Transcript_2980/g.6474 Transcript_2980/m.6474 type:complete len:737 (+) Transcript_2980:258-2468(+)
MSTEEFLPLTCNNSDGNDDGKIVMKNNDHSYTSSDQEENDEDAGCANYNHPNRFSTGKYGGYCNLGRVSMHDSWDFDASKVEEDDEIGRQEVSADISDGDDEHINGDFVSFWGHNHGDSPCTVSENQTHPEHLESPYAESSDNDDDDDGRVETTLRPIPLLYRNYQGGHGRNFGSWFQRELGMGNQHFNEKGGTTQSSRRRNNRSWGLGLGRRQSSDFDDFDDFDNSEDEGDTNSLLASSSTDSIIGHCIPTPTRMEQSSFRSNRAMKEEINANKHDNNIFGGRNRRGEGILALRVVRPFLLGTRRGFADNSDAYSTNEMEDDEDNNIADLEDNLSSGRDRAAVVQSISQGIVGTNNDSLLLDANCGDNDEQSTTNPPSNLLQKIFLTRFLQRPHGNRNNQAPIIQLHNLLRKEDWSLATSLLQSYPELAQTWHHIDRLYGGRYDGEALPIHAACALCPPPSFIEMLAALYPEGLVEKDKSFGRAPLHVACRSLAESSVIRVLCEMDPKCIEERDRLKRVPLHYLIKNYCTFGDNDDDISLDEGMEDENTNKEESDEDGMNAMKILISTNPNCVRAADHRGWLPLHVACSCSSRKGMIRVMKLLLKVWPESINAKTSKDSDALECVDMAGKHHPTKDKVISLLQEVKCKLDGYDPHGTGDDISESCEHGNCEEDRDESFSETSGEDHDGVGSDVSAPECELPAEKHSENSNKEDGHSTSSSSGETHSEGDASFINL